MLLTQIHITHTHTNTHTHMNTHRRYYLRAEGDPMQPLLYRLAAIVLFSVGGSITFTMEAHMAAPLTFLGE
jgi:hypothetical protein